MSQLQLGLTSVAQFLLLRYFIVTTDIFSPLKVSFINGRQDPWARHPACSRRSCRRLKGGMRRALKTIVLMLMFALAAAAQSGVPIISGGAGLISTTNGGQTSFQPVVAPVVVVPLGSKFTVESRFDLREFIAKNANGDYEGQGFTSIEYLQLDYHVAPQMTITAGRFLTPFNVYDERLTPIWIRNFEEAPIIFPIGTRTDGSSDGFMVRGAAVSKPVWELNYAAYFSTNSTIEKFQSGRAAGGRAGVFFTKPRLEIGTSYQRFLQDEHYNATGAYVWWQPREVPLDIRSEYAHAPGGQGYWVEGAFRFVNAPVGTSFIGRLEPLVRIQQFWRTKPFAGDALPANDQKKAEVGLNYHLPRQVRLNASYGRLLQTGGTDRNDWNVAVTYRFLFPMFPGQTK